MSVRTHCVNVVRGGPTEIEPDRGKDARSVRNVVVSFTYDGRAQTLRHSIGLWRRATPAEDTEPAPPAALRRGK